MKYKYEFKFITLANKSKFLIIDLPKEIGLFTAFLVQMCGQDEWYLEGINDVLCGKKEYEERDGEIYGLEIRKEITTLHDLFDQGEESKIETSELKELIEIWKKENKHQYS